jgi:hypothetical protein
LKATAAARATLREKAKEKAAAPAAKAGDGPAS